MADKQLTDLKTFIEKINKQHDKRNGKKINFGWMKRKKK